MFKEKRFFTVKVLAIQEHGTDFSPGLVNVSQWMISEWWECVKEGLILLTGSERMGRGQSCPFHKGTFL